MAKSPRSRSKSTTRKRRAAPPPAAARTEAQTGFELTNDHIETALQTGEHPGLLEDYFGPEEYAELRQLSREAAAQTVRGGPKVLILPGIMGSKIGRRGRAGIFDDVYWFDPIDIAAGRLGRLALPGTGTRFEPLGVMLITYLKLKLRLRIGGYDAEFHAFDWRQSIADLGKQLIGVLSDKGGEQVSIVAHSMGGLVARWALGNGGTCRRLVMLGTPNFGSFAPVQALRATYSVVRKVGALDLKHTPEQLAANVFSTFPGLTEMLPFPERFKDIDLYDLANWPDDRKGLAPRAGILSGVKAVQRKLAAGDERFFLIAGVDQETVRGIQKAEDGFTYSLSNAGDGTVPLDFARLPGVPTYYIPEGHGSLPNSRIVNRAVLDILDRGDTSALPTTYATEERASVVRQVPEDDLRIDPYAGRRGLSLSRGELRTMLEEVAAPYARTDVAAMPAPSAAVSATAVEALEPGYYHAFDRVVVGRRRQHRIDLRFASGSITEADARALAVGIFKDVAPSGAARALDERLDGAITDVSRRRMFSGNVGEIFVMPTGRHALAADYIAFVGLGAFDRFTDEVMQIAAENLVRTFVSCHVDEFATVLFGGGSGESAASALRNLLTGFIRGLTDADRDHRFRRLVICEWDQERFRELKGELFRLSSTPLCQDIEFTFDEVVLKAPPEIPAARRRAAPSKDPVYLIVRQEQSRDGEFDVRTSLLTAGQKATVVTGVRTVQERQLDSLISRLVSSSVKDLSADGQKLSKLLLSEQIHSVLPRYRDHHLIVVHDAPMSRVTWETMALATARKDAPWFPAAEAGLTHRYAAENLSVAKWLEERLQDNELTVLLVVNPTEDLDGAEEEGRRIQELLTNLPGSRLDVLRGPAATRPALLSAFSSGKYDLIHYAGHAFFDPKKPERSGILCHGGVVLSGADLAGLGNLPTLVFFNACESGRVRRGRGTRQPGANSRADDRVRQAVSGIGFAEAFMRGGIANFLATYWPVGDLAAKVFADEFYGRLIKGSPVREAIQNGRSAVRKSGSKDWADYLFYGDPEFVIKTSI